VTVITDELVGSLDCARNSLRELLAPLRIDNANEFFEMILFLKI